MFYLLMTPIRYTPSCEGYPSFSEAGVVFRKHDIGALMGPFFLFHLLPA